jgi:hypothetical protein
MFCLKNNDKATYRQETRQYNELFESFQHFGHLDRWQHKQWHAH